MRPVSFHAPAGTEGVVAPGQISVTATVTVSFEMKEPFLARWRAMSYDPNSGRWGPAIGVTAILGWAPGVEKEGFIDDPGSTSPGAADPGAS